MENGKERAFAMLEPNGSFTQYGLTKREYFAAMAMQAFLMCPTPPIDVPANEWTDSKLAQRAIECADATLKALEVNG